MTAPDPITTLQEFIADYIVRRGYFKAELAELVPESEDVPLVLQMVYWNKTGDKIKVVFTLPPDLDARDPPDEVRKAVQECLDAAKAAHAELVPLAYEIGFIK